MNQYKYRYRIHGLIIASEIQINGFKDYSNLPIDVTILIGDIPEKYEAEKSIYSFSEEEGLFQIPGVGRFYISSGNRIIVNLNLETQLEDVGMYLLGSVFTILLMQRGAYPLHGCTITDFKHTFLIVGDSKAGKSTIARKAVEEGYQILSDDVTLVKVNDEGRIIAYPSYPSQKLWVDSMNVFGIPLEGKKQLFKRLDKYYLDDEKAFCGVEKELDAMIQLTSNDKTQLVELRLLSGSAKVQALINNTYRYEYVIDMGKKAAHFNFIRQIINEIDIYSMTRPTNVMTVDDQFEAIKHIGEKKDEWFDLGINRIS